MINGIYIGDTSECWVSELPVNHRKLSEGEMNIYCEYTDGDMKVKIPTTFDSPVIISTGGKVGGVATCIIANLNPIYDNT